MTSSYADLIGETLGVDDDEAAVVEEVLRVEFPTLDHLSRGELRRHARAASRTLAALREVDPETARFYEEQAR